jgi:hypothetical protein
VTEATEPSAASHTYASAIIGAQQKWERKPADFYPTPVDATWSLLPYIARSVRGGSWVWEPACGDGAMSRVLTRWGYRVHSTDLREDTGFGEGGVDYLTEPPSRRFSAIITNPPFSAARAFIEKAVTEAPVVAMLLKSQYWHAAKRQDLFNEYPPAAIHPLTWRPSFLEKERGNSPLMDVMWCVWNRDHWGQTIYQPIDRKRYPGPENEFEELL